MSVSFSRRREGIFLRKTLVPSLLWVTYGHFPCFREPCPQPLSLAFSRRRKGIFRSQRPLSLAFWRRRGGGRDLHLLLSPGCSKSIFPSSLWHFSIVIRFSLLRDYRKMQSPFRAEPMASKSVKYALHTNDIKSGPAHLETGVYCIEPSLGAVCMSHWRPPGGPYEGASEKILLVTHQATIPLTYMY